MFENLNVATRRHFSQVGVNSEQLLQKGSLLTTPFPSPDKRLQSGKCFSNPSPAIDKTKKLLLLLLLFFLLLLTVVKICKATLAKVYLSVMIVDFSANQTA